MPRIVGALDWVRLVSGRSELHGRDSWKHSSEERVLEVMKSSEKAGVELLLVRELTHRVNNEFASAIQLASLTAARSRNRDVKLALAEVTERLHNYAKVHQALQVPANDDQVDGSEYLHHLCSTISRSKLDGLGIQLVLVEQSFQMSADRCWAVGMIVAELIANAARHGVEPDGGTIRVECFRYGGCVECRVSDTGRAILQHQRRGSGLRIIEALAERLDATFELRRHGTGIESVLVVPIEGDQSTTFRRGT